VGIDTVYEYYVGTTIGLYSALSIYDSSSTLTWAREGNNVLNMPVVTSLDLRNNDNTLLVGTHGNGMYYTQIPNPIPLPVTWLDFTATRQDKNVELKWSTAQELNAQKFVVQRRYQDETDFRDIGEVTARGNANTPQHYSFNDLNITQTGTVYYRLKQVDRDGRISYSRTVNVKFNDRTSQFVQLLYPNPVKDILIIKTGHAAGIQSIQFSLIDQSGKIIIKKKIPYSDQSIGLDHIPAGLYYVRMSDQTGNNNFVQKIIKQ
jgi:hypothetical protein